MGWLRRKNPWHGDCSSCGHDWREHETDDAGSALCSECVYEIDHDVPDAPAQPCRLAPPDARASSGDASVPDTALRPTGTDSVVLKSSLAPPLPWGAGRLGIITGNEEFLGRLVLVCPYVRDRSEFVIYIADQDLTESFWGARYLPEALNDLKIIWIAPGPAEEQLERAVFDIRHTFRKPG